MKSHCVEVGRAAGYYSGAEIGKSKQRALQTERHYRVVDGEYSFGFGKISFKFVGHAREFFSFVVLAHIRFYNAHSFYILLNGFVERVVTFEYFFKYRHGEFCHDYYRKQQNRHGYEKYPRQLRIYGKAHDYREYKHKRTTDGGTYYHHERHLNVADIGRKTSYQRRRAEFVDIGKRITLYRAEHIVSEIFCKARRSLCSEFAAQHTGNE